MRSALQLLCTCFLLLGVVRGSWFPPMQLSSSEWSTALSRYDVVGSYSKCQTEFTTTSTSNRFVTSPTHITNTTHTPHTTHHTPHTTHHTPHTTHHTPHTTHHTPHTTHHTPHTTHHTPHTTYDHTPVRVLQELTSCVGLLLCTKRKHAPLLSQVRVVEPLT